MKDYQQITSAVNILFTQYKHSERAYISFPAMDLHVQVIVNVIAKQNFVQEPKPFTNIYVINPILICPLTKYLLSGRYKIYDSKTIHGKIRIACLGPDIGMFFKMRYPIHMLL